MKLIISGSPQPFIVNKQWWITNQQQLVPSLLVHAKFLVSLYRRKFKLRLCK